MSYRSETKCDLCGEIIITDSSDSKPDHKQKSFDLWLNPSGFDYDPESAYPEINIDICEKCEPAFRDGLERLIAYLKVENPEDIYTINDCKVKFRK
jgi:ribosomal protein L31